MDAVVSPVLQAYVTPGLAVVEIVAVNTEHVRVLLTEAVTVGTAVSLTTVAVTRAVQPLVLVTVTE
jgi:hypothetical protein